MKKLFFIVLLIPFIGFSQTNSLWDITRIQYNASPTITVGFLTMSFTANSGTASSPQIGSIAFSGLAGATGAVAAQSPYEYSINNGSSYTSSLSGLSNGTYSVYIRVAQSAAQGSYGPNTVNVTATGAATKTFQLNATVAATPTNTVSPSSITSLNATAGTAGTAQTVTNTFVNNTITATTDITSIAEMSKDGGSTWASSQTYSSGSPVGLQIRVKASATAQSYSGTLTLTASNGPNRTVPISGSITNPSTTKIYILMRDSVNGVPLYNPSTINNYTPVSGASLTSAPLKWSDGTQSTVQIIASNLNSVVGNSSQGTFGSGNTLGYPVQYYYSVAFSSSAGTPLTFNLTGLTNGVWQIDILSSTNLTGLGGSYPEQVTWNPGGLSQSGINAFNNISSLFTKQVTVTAGTANFTIAPTSGNAGIATFITLTPQ